MLPPVIETEKHILHVAVFKNVGFKNIGWNESSVINPHNSALYIHLTSCTKVGRGAEDVLKDSLVCI